MEEVGEKVTGIIREIKKLNRSMWRCNISKERVDKI